MSILHNNVEMFHVDGICMLGNFDNGTIIGLNDNGEKYIKSEWPTVTTPSNKQQLEIYEALNQLQFFKKDKNKNIEAAYIHVTDRCNLHCIGCYSYVDERNNTKDLKFNDICYILDNLRISNTKKIVFSGGRTFYP